MSKIKKTTMAERACYGIIMLFIIGIMRTCERTTVREIQNKQHITNNIEIKPHNPTLLKAIEKVSEEESSIKAALQCPMEQWQTEKVYNDKDLQLAIAEIGFYRMYGDSFVQYCERFTTMNNYKDRFTKTFTNKTQVENIMRMKLGEKFFNCFKTKMENIYRENDFNLIDKQQRDYAKNTQLKTKVDFCKMQNTSLVLDVTIQSYQTALENLRKSFR